MMEDKHTQKTMVQTTYLADIAVDGLRDGTESHTLRMVQTEAQTALQRGDQPHHAQAPDRAGFGYCLLTSITPAKCAMVEPTGLGQTRGGAISDKNTLINLLYA